MYPDFTWMFWLCCFLWTDMGYIWIHHTFMMWVKMFMTSTNVWGVSVHMSGWEITKNSHCHLWLGNDISLVIFTRKKVPVSRNWNYQTLHNTAALLTFIFVVNLNMEFEPWLFLGGGPTFRLSFHQIFSTIHFPFTLDLMQWEEM